MNVRCAGLLTAAVLFAADSCIAAALAQQGAAAELRRWGINVPPLDDLSETRDRPLFSPSREPPAERSKPVAATPAPAAAPPPQEAVFELTGIVMGEDLAVAVLRNRTSEQVQRVRHGETVAGWTVAEIGRRHVVLRRDSVTQRLQLFQTPGKPSDRGSQTPEATPQLPQRAVPAGGAAAQPQPGVPVPGKGPPTQQPMPRPLKN